GRAARMQGQGRQALRIRGEAESGRGAARRRQVRLTRSAKGWSSRPRHAVSGIGSAFKESASTYRFLTIHGTVGDVKRKNIESSFRGPHVLIRISRRRH